MDNYLDDERIKDHHNNNNMCVMCYCNVAESRRCGAATTNVL